MRSENKLERRSADRVSDSSLLIVAGLNRMGQSFRENTYIKDVSPGGISFTLATPIEAGGILELSICSEQGAGNEFLLKFQTSARVLRVCQDKNSSGHFAVAARFEGEVINLTNDHEQDALIRELERAVQYDESRRHQFE